MTDQTIPADDLRGFIARYRTSVNGQGSFLLDELEALLPAPPRPTLEDMTDEERAACQWMQADVGVERRIIVRVMDVEEGAVTLVESGDTVVCPHSSVTPRPDLPRMEWPSTGQDGEEAAKVDYVSVAGGRTAYGPWTVARLRKKPAPAPAPPNTLTKGSEWDNVDALARACRESGRDQITVIDTDGDVFVWGVDAEWWETGLPGCDYAPHTIIHTGKKADQ